MKHLHILGISGTFMSALALLAREAGFTVSGCDANCYPPVSDLLKEKGIVWVEGYDNIDVALKADVVIVGNAVKRGMPVIEAVLNAGIPYISGPQWLAENILPQYKVIAVAGTHGKTTTTSMLAFILSYAGFDPGFLIGGVSTDFNTSAKLGKGAWFVIEADEYDTAFFDKRPKFMHYRPTIAILNNLEFDHADIYPDLAAIQQQFHYLIRTIPSDGLIIKPKEDNALNEVLLRGCFSHLETFQVSDDATWRAELLESNGQSFKIWYQEEMIGQVDWTLMGLFNVENALAAMAASIHAGVSPRLAAEALSVFQPVKRRLEVKMVHQGVTFYDDFAHHPTAIKKTIDALKQSGKHRRVYVLLELASYTMRVGGHAQHLESALVDADGVFILNPADFSLQEIAKNWTFPYQILSDRSAIVNAVMLEVEEQDAVVVMSNRSVSEYHQAFLKQLLAES